MPDQVRASLLFVEDESSMNNWEEFERLSERDQCSFLLTVAFCAWGNVPLESDIEEVRDAVLSYLRIARRVLDGQVDLIQSLIIFLDDPAMVRDFSHFYEVLGGKDRAQAALDLASYACGFIARVASEESGVQELSDPVLESVPEIYKYYTGRAEFLGC